MSHTHGPWTAGSFSSIVGVPITAQPDKAKNTVLVASTFTAANARLIAAAPELLEALIAMREHAEHSTPQGAQAFLKTALAIAKATGGAE